MKIRFGILREVKVDNNIDSLDINTSGKEIRANQIPADTVPEIVEDTVTVVLKHLGVGVEARVSELRDLLGQQLHTVGGVTEDNRLVDL